MALTKHKQTTKFVRGGQTTQHWWRMAAQVLRTSLFVGLAAFTISYVYLVAANYELRFMRESFAMWNAEFNVARGLPEKVVSYTDATGQRQRRLASEIVKDSRIQEVASRYRDNAQLFVWISLIPAVLALLASAAIFVWAGRAIGENEHVRGSRLIAQPDLMRWSRAKWKTYERRFGKGAKKGPRYTIAGIQFPPNAVEAQTGIFGTVGVGKTNAIKELLTTIRESGGRAIIYDRMGGLVRDFYDPATDVIVNPFDARSRVWSPFLEAKSPEALAQIAEVMIPQRPGQSDPFWSQTARLVFEYAARSLLKAKRPTNRDLRQAIMTISAEELEKLLAGTPGAHFFGKHVEKTSASIRANMIAELRFLEFLRDDGEPFSIREWVQAGESAPGFVFLTGDAEHSAATRNIISTMVEVAANALMTCDESREPRLWFFLDEVPSLNRLPFLISKLAEIRQFGGAFVLGYQVYSQLEDIYGEKGAQSISGTLNNRVVFNTPDARTAKLFSEALGFEDIVEQRENLSFGAHESRDGVSFVSQRTERPIVTASEIQALPQFEAYIRFAYDAPTAKVAFGPVPIEPKAEKLVPYQGAGFDLDAMDPHKTLSRADQPSEQSLSAKFAPELADVVREERLSKFAAWSPASQIAAFDKWRERGETPEYNTTSGRMEAPLAGVPIELLWDHYFRQRVAGRDEPLFRLIPNTSQMVSSRPRASGEEAENGQASVPSYLAIRNAAARDTQSRQTGLPSPSGAAPENDDLPPCPLEDAMEDKGSLL